MTTPPDPPAPVPPPLPAPVIGYATPTAYAPAPPRPPPKAPAAAPVPRSYEIVGTDRATGRRTKLVVTAGGKGEAEAWADARGVLRPTIREMRPPRPTRRRAPLLPPGPWSGAAVGLGVMGGVLLAAAAGLVAAHTIGRLYDLQTAWSERSERYERAQESPREWRPVPGRVWSALQETKAERGARIDRAEADSDAAFWHLALAYGILAASAAAAVAGIGLVMTAFERQARPARGGAADPAAASPERDSAEGLGR